MPRCFGLGLLCIFFIFFAFLFSVFSFTLIIREYEGGGGCAELWRLARVFAYQRKSAFFVVDLMVTLMSGRVLSFFLLRTGKYIVRRGIMDAVGYLKNVCFLFVFCGVSRAMSHDRPIFAW